jgi:hypothetical protein
MQEAPVSISDAAIHLAARRALTAHSWQQEQEPVYESDNASDPPAPLDPTQNPLDLLAMPAQAGQHLPIQTRVGQCKSITSEAMECEGMIAAEWPSGISGNTLDGVVPGACRRRSIGASEHRGPQQEYAQDVRSTLKKLETYALNGTSHASHDQASEFLGAPYATGLESNTCIGTPPARLQQADTSAGPSGSNALCSDIFIGTLSASRHRAGSFVGTPAGCQFAASTSFGTSGVAQAAALVTFP